jgi:hypothetical protein
VVEVAVPPFDEPVGVEQQRGTRQQHLGRCSLLVDACAEQQFFRQGHVPCRTVCDQQGRQVPGVAEQCLPLPSCWDSRAHTQVPVRPGSSWDSTVSNRSSSWPGGSDRSTDSERSTLRAWPIATAASRS